MRKLLILSVLTAFPFASPLAAQDIDCANAMAQQEMNICAHRAYLAADEDLNLAYKIAMAYARDLDEYLVADEKPAADMLREAQRAWIKFRDLACAVEGTQVRGGSMQPLFVASCLERETRARTESLRLFGEIN